MSRFTSAAASSFALLALAGCAGPLPLDPARGDNNPANPDASTAVLAPPSATLDIADADAPTRPPDRHQDVGPAGGMNMGGMKMGGGQKGGGL